MKRRAWDSKSKARIVLEGLQCVANICSEYQITQNMNYRWRDTFLANAAQFFETGTISRREDRLAAENQKLKQAVGELTLELKKRLVSSSRRTGQAQLCRDAELMPLLEAFKMDHSFWGYRRV